MITPNDGLNKPEGAPPGTLRALIVEDEILIAWQLKDTLEELGLEVDEFVSNGAKALELIQRTKYEVLFMDVNLIGSMDGAETAHRIREQADTPIVFVTAYAQYDSIYNDLRRIERSVVIGKPALPHSVKEALQALGLLQSHG